VNTGRVKEAPWGPRKAVLYCRGKISLIRNCKERASGDLGGSGGEKNRGEVKGIKGLKFWTWGGGVEGTAGDVGSTFQWDSGNEDVPMEKRGVAK